MGIVYFLALVLLLAAALVFTALLRVVFLLDTEKEDIRLTLFWMYPFLKATIESKASIPVLSVQCFNRNIYRKEMQPGKNKGGNRASDLVRSASARDISVEASYGFIDPYITGLTCGAVSAASSQINRAFIKQNPDFMAGSDYILLNATAKINLGTTIVNYLKCRASK